MLEAVARMIAEGKDFSEILRFIMESKGWSVTKLSERTGIPLSTLYKLLRGERPRYETIVKVLQALKERGFVAVIAARYVLEDVELPEGVKPYPANSFEEVIVSAVRAEREGAAAIVCAPIASGIVEKIVSVPVVTIRPRGSILKAVEQALKRVG
ncbi:MAG: helix-turn-helix domain-containing protein [Archaeoglobaceae archaeon]